MALSIPLDPHDTGLICRYWRITQAQIDHMRQSVTVWLHGWRDDAARMEGRTPAGSLTLHLESKDMDTDLHEATTATFYQALKRRAASVEADIERPLGVIDAGVLAAARDC